MSDTTSSKYSGSRRRRSRRHHKRRRRPHHRHRRRRRRSRTRSRSPDSDAPATSRRRLFSRSQSRQESAFRTPTTGTTPEQIASILQSLIASANTNGTPANPTASTMSRHSNVVPQQMLKGKLPEDLKFRFN